ncbi:MAG: carboxypeptidase regulatory-like domain-containing protein [Vicinamibacterales bacterium]
MTLSRSVLALFVLAASAYPAAAQIDQGRLTGIVTDAQQGILPGVTVTAQSPALIGVQTAVTETDGRYRFPSLPPGRYTLTFELGGFQTTKRENIVLALGQTLNVDIQLSVATLQESVTVTAESPVVDISSTKIGSEFGSEKLATIPSATDLWATLSQAPGVRMRGFDVGGSHKSQQSGYESFGVRNQNRVVTDGVDTTEGTGGAGIYQDFFAHEEITVSAAGGDVTMMTPGSAVFSTIKSGGNAFKSFNNLTYENGSWVGDNIDSETSKRGFTGQPNLIFWEGHTDLGGPVKRDKVWFYAAYNHFKIDKIISGVAEEFSDLGVFDNATGKMTYKASSKDTIAAYYQWARKYKPRRGLSNTTGPDSILAQDSKSWMYNAQWQRVWTNRLFVDTKVGLFGFGWPMEPSVPFDSNPPRNDTGTGVSTGAGWLAGSAGGPFTFDRNKPQVNVTATYYLPEAAGSHDFKFGFEWLDDQSKFANNGTAGPIFYRDRDGAVDLIRITDLGAAGDFGSGWTGADDRNGRIAAFIQDRWSLNQKVSLTLGLRLDRQKPHYQDSVRNPLITEVFQPVTVPGKTLLTSTKIVPRVGVSYSPTDDGKTVLKGFYGRYYYNFADRMSNLNPGGTNTADYRFNDLNGNRLYDGPQELGVLVASAGGNSTTLDPDLKTPYADEFNLSFERQFWGESSARVAYVRKMTHDEFTTVNIARVGQFTVPTTVTVNLSDYVNGATGPTSLNVFDIPSNLRGVVQNVVTNIPETVGGGDDTFDTVSVGFNKRFPGGLFFQSSFDYQWRNELRRGDSASTSPLTADPIATGYNANGESFPTVENRQKSQNWSARFLGRYVFPYDVGFATNIRLQSGWPYARRVQYALPNAGTATVFLENIDNNYSDTVGIVDLRVDKTFSVERFNFSVIADLFNALNSNAVTNFNLSNGSQFNRIIATLDPRTFQLAVRFSF